MNMVFQRRARHCRALKPLVEVSSGVAQLKM
jgi:hypothetical protein